MTSGSSWRGITLAGERGLESAPPRFTRVTKQFGQLGAEAPILRTLAIPTANDVRRRGVESRDLRQPEHAGVDVAMTHGRMVPTDVRRKTAHRQRAREAAVDEQRAAFLQQLNHAVEARIADVGQPVRLQLANELTA